MAVGGKASDFKIVKRHVHSGNELEGLSCFGMRPNIRRCNRRWTTLTEVAHAHTQGCMTQKLHDSMNISGTAL